MSVDLSKLMSRISKISEMLVSKPEFRWAVVTSVDPVRIRFDGDENPLLGRVDSLISGLEVNNRVYAAVQNRRVTVIGKGGGPELMLPAGLIPIVPGSIDKSGANSDVSVTTLGKVYFEECTALILNDVFTDDYENYRVMIRINRGANANTQMNARLTTNGAGHNAASQLGYGHYVNSSGTVAGSSSAVRTLMLLGWITNLATNARSTYAVDIYGPATNTFASYTSTSMSYVASSVGGTVTAAQAFDGLAIFADGSPPLGGSIQIFGYNEGEIDG